MDEVKAVTPIRLVIEDDQDAGMMIDRLVEWLKAQDPSRERSLAITNLQQGRLWLNEVIRHS